MNTGPIIVTVEGGIPDVVGNDADIEFIDFDIEDVDYDTAFGWVEAVIRSDLDGPTQFRLIKRISERFLAACGE